MKRIIVALVVLISINVMAEPSGRVVRAIAEVESGGQINRDTCVGDKGKAVGRYQIWETYVDDVNRILGYKKYSYEDRKNASKSIQMVYIYLTHYGKRYERLTGKKCTDEIYARIHNGGPNGWRKESTVKYWHKVQIELQRGK